MPVEPGGAAARMGFSVPGIRLKMGEFAKLETGSYRRGPTVPEFDDRGPMVFMSGECARCSPGARVIARLKRLCGPGRLMMVFSDRPARLQNRLYRRVVR